MEKLWDIKDESHLSSHFKSVLVIVSENGVYDAGQIIWE